MKKRWWIVIGIVILVMILGGHYFIKSSICHEVYKKITDDELNLQVSKMFENKDFKLYVYPNSRIREIEPGSKGEIGIGINNLVKENSYPLNFSYNITAVNIAKSCIINNETAKSFILSGKEEQNIQIMPGKYYAARILFSIPEDSPLCSIRYRINVYLGETKNLYATDSFNINIIKKKHFLQKIKQNILNTIC